MSTFFHNIYYDTVGYSMSFHQKSSIFSTIQLDQWRPRHVVTRHRIFEAIAVVIGSLLDLQLQYFGEIPGNPQLGQTSSIWDMFVYVCLL
jgi:hypothetical protein